MGGCRLAVLYLDCGWRLAVDGVHVAFVMLRVFRLDAARCSLGPASRKRVPVPVVVGRHRACRGSRQPMRARVCAIAPDWIVCVTWHAGVQDQPAQTDAGTRLISPPSMQGSATPSPVPALADSRLFC